MNEWARSRRQAESLRAGLHTDPETLAPAVADHLLERAFAAEGLRVRPRPASDPLLSGAHAVLDREARTIWVRSDARAPERRLILGHELGHVRLHHAPEDCRCDPDDFEESGLAAGYGPRQRRETEANVFARSFLLPPTLARELFEERGWNADQIARRVGVPLTTVYLQLAQPAHIPDPPPLPSADATSLDPSQSSAATAKAGPLLVGAGPGTGKTRTLTARILHLIRDRGVPPEHILALTFSRKAAEEMRDRVAGAAPELSGRLAITTFHAYGFDLIRRHYEIAGLPPIPILVGEAEAFALLEQRIAELPLRTLRYLHDPTFPLPDVLRGIARAKEALVSPEDLADEAERTGSARWAEVARIYGFYERALRSVGAVDYADLVALPLRLLDENPTALAAERGRWREILVDEYQDINRAGAGLVQRLAGPDGAGLWAVGDLRQAIYAFRGASPANVTQFQSDFPGGKRLELAVNYRSRPALVDLFGRVSREEGNGWEPQRTGEATVALAIAVDEDAQADGISAQLREFRAEGYRWADVAVLCRTRNQARNLRTALGQRGVVCAPSPDDSDLLRQPEAKEILALLDRIAEPGGPSSTLAPDLPKGFSSAPDAWPDEILASLLWGKSRLAAQLASDGALAGLLTLARSFRERAALLVPEGVPPVRAFLLHVRRMARLGVPLKVEDEGQAPDAVAVLTVHASKGLEFPIVFLPNLIEGRFPPRTPPSLLSPMPGGESAGESEEERLFFVALSRARDHLILSYPERTGRWAARPSPLLAAVVGKVPELRWRRPSVWADDEIPPPDDRWPDDTVDATLGDVELYLSCPRRYRFERLERIVGGRRNPYNLLRRAVDAEEETGDAFEAAWERSGRDPNDPLRAFYRSAADGLEAPPGAPADELTVTLPSGTVRVRADVETEDGTWEIRTLRKPPEPDERPPYDLRQALLQAADAPRRLRVRYLQNGQTALVPDSPRARNNRLADAERALRGIALKVFPATPSDPASCPVCPFFFCCPRDGDGRQESPPEAPKQAT